MTNKTICATVAACLLTLFIGCSSGGQMRNNANSKKPPVAEPDDGTTAEGKGEGEGEGSSAGGEGETTGDDTDGGDLPYKADHSLYYGGNVKNDIDTYCISCHTQQIPSLSSFESIRNNAEDIKASLINRTMPPAGSVALPDSVRLTLVNWILAGTKNTPSEIAIEKPLRLNTPEIDGKGEVTLRISANTLTPTWRLFYTATQGAKTGGTLISNSTNTNSNPTITWNTSTVTPGTYYLYVELTDTPESAVAASDGSFRVGLPSIVLASGWRNGKKAFLSTADLEYTVQHKNDSKVYKVDVAVKKGAGAFQTVATGVTDLSKVTLPGSATLTDGIDYTFKVTLFENDIEVHSDESVAPVGISDDPISYLSLRTEFVDAKCGAACHVTGIASYDSDNYTVANPLLAEKMVDHLSDPTSPMPPLNKTQLTIGERERMTLWFWLGAAP